MYLTSAADEQQVVLLGQQLAAAQAAKGPLLHFARRRALATVRHNNAATLTEAFDALSTIDTPGVEGDGKAQGDHAVRAEQ